MAPDGPYALPALREARVVMVRRRGAGRGERRPPPSHAPVKSGQSPTLGTSIGIRTNTEDMNNAINSLNNPTMKCILWLPRTIPMTTGIVFLLCVIHGIGGDIDDLRETWGLDPGKPFSWITHAFLHTDNQHLGENMLMFLPSSGLIELYIGRTKLAAIILFTAMAAAVTSSIAVPEYWDTKINPVGLSAVAYATFVLGAYMGARIVAIQAARVLTATPILKRLQDWPWATMGTVAGMIATGIWLTLAIGNEWANQDAAPRVAHSFGIITGGTIAILMAITTDRRGNRRFRKSTTGLAIAVSTLVVLNILLVDEI